MTGAAIADRLAAALTDHEAGRRDAAEAGYRAILHDHAQEPDALNLLGVLLQERGDLPQSIALLRRAVAAAADFPEALTNLARALRLAGEPAAAAEQARLALALDPDMAEAHLNLGQALIAMGNHAGGAVALRRAAGLAPQPAAVLTLLGTALLRTDDAAGAAKVLAEALALEPDRLDAMVHLGAALAELDRFAEAVEWHEKAVALAPREPAVHAALATTLSKRGDPQAAAAACRAALALAPDRLDLRLALAGNLANLGRFDEAESCCREVLAREPDSAAAKHELSRLGRSAAASGDLARLREVAADATAPAAERIAAGMAMGTVLDKSGDYDAAFAAFAAANRLIRARWVQSGENFDVAGLRRYVDWAIASFTPELCAATRDGGDPSELPVFVVGMPRSGTSLAEQIAASHPEVFGAGERKDIATILQALSGGAAGFVPARWDRNAVRREAAAHLARLHALGGAAARVIDKMPDNVRVLGQIAMLFPRARFVVCRRDLRDVCLSCYFQHFGEPMVWTTDQADLAARAREIDRLTTHWCAVLAPRVLELRYETLVANPEAESRRLIAFLGLEWDPACLAFHQTERPVLTASLWQVRQPLYNSSVGRWLHYRRHLGPLLEGLRGLV